MVFNLKDGGGGDEETPMTSLSPLHAMAKLRREKICRWRCQWSMVSLGAIALVVYNAVANVWLLQEPRCASPSPPPEPGTCEPCLNTPPLPVDDDPIARLDLRLGRWDTTRSYRLFDYAALGNSYADSSTERRVCLATQTSIERIHELLKIAAHWSAAISVAVFVAADELKLLRGYTTWLFYCEPEIYSRLALHVVMPADRAGTLGSLPKWSKDCTTHPQPSKERAPDTIQWRGKHPYPQNHLRNLARKHCQSPFVFLVDIDIVPSRNMAEALDEFLARARCPQCAYVVPTYELDYQANFPANKSELLRLSRRKLAIPFHKKVFIYNQYASNFSLWEASGGNESMSTHVSHNVTNFEMLYEPFYVAPDTVPPHDERFVGYGFTRNSQVYEMFMAGYQFRVLSPIFTIHWGLQSRRYRPVWRENQNEKNHRQFETFKRELFARYRKDPLHLLRKRPAPKKT